MRFFKYAPFYIISLLPLGLLHLISGAASLLLYYVLRYRRDVVSKNLRSAFPSKDAAEIEQIAKKFYRHFCDVWIESVKVLTISKRSARKRFKIANPEVLHNLYQKQTSVILYASHFANWEWLAFLPLTLEHTVTSFYQPLSSEYFDGLMTAIRSRFGVDCIPSAQGYKTLMKYKSAGTTTLNIMVGDQSPGDQSASEWITFLGIDTAFFNGPSRIATKAKQTVVFPAYKLVKRGYYEVTFKILEQNEQTSITQAYAQFLESQIKASPSMWLWSHRRWKIKRPVLTATD